MEMLRPAPYCDAFPGETKTIKPIINLAFVASSGDIITDYDDLYTVGVDRLSAPILSILQIIDIRHFQNRCADNFSFFLLFFFLLCKQTYYLQVTLFIGE